MARNCPELIRKDCNKLVAKVIREGMKAAERVRGYCTRPKDNSNRPGDRIGRGKERKKKRQIETVITSARKHTLTADSKDDERNEKNPIAEQSLWNDEMRRKQCSRRKPK